MAKINSFMILMLNSSLTVLPFLFWTSSCAATSSATFNNALALIENQSDLTLFAGLIRRDPKLVKLFTSVKNVTIAAAVDSSFPTTDTSAVLYSNKEAVQAIIEDTVIEGRYPLNAITTNPIYADTKLSNPRSVDTSRGRAVAKLEERNGKKTVTLGVGTRANITSGNLRFKYGILHKVSNPLSSPEPFFPTAARLNISAISKLPAPFVGSFESIAGSRDTTLFSVTNEALESLTASNPNFTLAQFVDTLAGYIVTPGVFFENTFTGRTVQTLNGAKLRLSGFGTGPTLVNDAVVVQSDIFATNGVLHILDRPLTLSRY